ncbi:MAG: hypothetical protein HY236_06690 [Acidobacteria bacterium]|nr:hypothetical protein [Acidobacteriota bacterium]
MAETRSARQRLLDFFSCEPGELGPTLLLTFYLLLGIASVIAMKSASSSLYLARFRPQTLPYVNVAIAVMMALVASLYIKLSVRLPQNLLVIYTQLFFASHLVLFWWLLRLRLDWMPAVIYVWTGIYAVIIPTQVWTLANHIFTTRQARRLFPYVGSGGILGAALGGLFSHQMAPVIGTPNLLLTYVAFPVACAGIVNYLWHSSKTLAPAAAHAGKQPQPTSLAESIHAVFSNRYLTLMTVMVVLSAVLNIMVDYQFKFIVRAYFTHGDLVNRDGMTSFFAGFSAYLALFSFLMHLMLSSRVMRWFGLNFAIFVLPISMLLGSSILLFSAGLLAGVLLKGFDGAFRHSIDRSSTELLYVPLPGRVRQQAKSFIDMVATRSADGLGALLLILLASVWNFSVQRLSWVNLALVLPWLGVAWMLRREYVNTLRSSIERRDVSPDTLLSELAGSAPSEDLAASLASSDERAVESGLGWLQYGQFNVAYAHLASLLTHVSPAIRRKAIAMVAAKSVPDCAEQVVRFLYLDDHVESLWAGLDYLERNDTAEAHLSRKELLESPHAVLRGTAMARLVAKGDPAYREQAYQTFTAFVEAARRRNGPYRLQAAELLGLVPADLPCQSALGDFLSDSSPEIVRAAVISAGRTRRLDLVPLLIERAGDRRLKTEVREALAAFGEEILPVIHQAIEDARVPLKIRRNLPRVFAANGGQRSADFLVQHLEQPDLTLAYQALRALSRIRLKQPEVRFDPNRITPLILSQLRGYYRRLSILQCVPQNGPQAGTRFLRRALAEQMARRLEIIFRLIGLLYPAKDINDAYHGVTSGRRDLRANALEFLDTVLVNPVRQMLLPVLEDRSPERVMEFARSQLGIGVYSYAQALRELLAEPDPWLQSCATYAVADQDLPEFEPLLDLLLDADDALLRETIRTVRSRRRDSIAAPATAMPGAPTPPLAS